MKKYLYAFTLLFFVSCEKEETTNYYAYLKNATTHTIQIRFFSQGQVVNQNTLTLNQDTTIRIANGYDRGINNGYDRGINIMVRSVQNILKEWILFM